MKNFRSALLAAALSLVVAAGSATAAQATTKIRVGASPTPHAEILKVANDVLKPQGYELQIIEYSDYVQPNMALEGKELDANFFQHKPYLDDFNKEKGTKLVSIGTVHYEPFGIYAGKTKSLGALKDGAMVAVPNDTTNEARALLLLQSNGLIKLKDGAGLTATPRSSRSKKSKRLSSSAPCLTSTSRSSTATTPSSAASKWPTRCPPKRPTPSPRRPTPISSPCVPEMKTVLNSKR